MADYEPGHYRSGFEDDERRAPYATDFGSRAETRYATGYGYGPTYGGTAGAYGAAYGGAAGGYGYGGAGHGATSHIGTGTYGRSAYSGATYGGTGRGSRLTSEAGYGSGRFGTSHIGREEATAFGTHGWREEAAGERRYPDSARTGSGWIHQAESRFGEPGRAGLSQSVTGMQGFGAFGPGVPAQRRRIGNRQYGPY